MSASPSPCPLSVIVTRLRAAGCVFAEDETRLILSAAGNAEELAAMVDRRAAGLPVEHVLGWAEFCGLRIFVDPGVFVPRRRTEFLVRQAVALARDARRRDASDIQDDLQDIFGIPDFSQAAGPRTPPVVVDLCCGSGAVGVAVATAAGGTALHAVDLDPAAVRCARRNVPAAGGQVYEGDLYRPLPATLRGRVDVLLANVPYVPTRQVALLPPEARLHEPTLALDGGADGLDLMRRVTAAAPLWLAPGGHLLVETGEHQAAEAAEIVARHGLMPRVARRQELNATVVIGAAPRREGGGWPESRGR